MGKVITIVVLLAAELAFMAGHLTVLLTKQPPVHNSEIAEKKTAALLVACAVIVLTNATVCYVILYLTDSRRWYDFALVLIPLMETLAGVIVTLLFIPILWFHVSWDSMDTFYKLLRALKSIDRLSHGAYLFTNYCPVMVLGLQIYQHAYLVRGKLSTRAVLTPVIFTTLVAFGLSFIMSECEGEEDSEWIHIFLFVISYALPAVMAIILVVALKLFLRQPDEEFVEAGRVFKIFTVLSASFILLSGPMYIGKIVYIHGSLDIILEFDYQKFQIITGTMFLMKSLLNLPLLMAVDDHFYRGCVKLSRKCLLRRIQSWHSGSQRSPTVHYTSEGDAEALIEET